MITHLFLSYTKTWHFKYGRKKLDGAICGVMMLQFKIWNKLWILMLYCWTSCLTGSLSLCVSSKDRYGSVCWLTWGGNGRLGGGQAEAVVNVGRQQVVAAMLVQVPLQVLVDLVNQRSHGFKGRPAKVHYKYIEDESRCKKDLQTIFEQQIIYNCMVLAWHHLRFID